MGERARGRRQLTSLLGGVDHAAAQIPHGRSIDTATDNNNVSASLFSPTTSLPQIAEEFSVYKIETIVSSA